MHVASLDTLKMLVLSPTQVGDDRQRKRRQTSLELPSVLEGARMPRQLYIILKVSHAFCVAMQDVEATAASSPNDTGEDQYQKDLLNSWRRIGEILSGLLGLARVDVWIDHRSIEMWATFNERAIAKPITQFASKHGDEVSTIKQLADAERLLIKRGVDVKAGRALFEDFMNQDAPEEYRDPDMPEPRYRFPGSDIWNQFFNRHNRYMERVYGQSECVYEQPECSFEEYWQGQVRKRQTKQDGVETARNEASR